MVGNPCFWARAQERTLLSKPPHNSLQMFKWVCLFWRVPPKSQLQKATCKPSTVKAPRPHKSTPTKSHFVPVNGWLGDPRVKTVSLAPGSPHLRSPPVCPPSPEASPHILCCHVSHRGKDEASPYSKYPLFVQLEFVGKPIGFPWQIPPFLVEGRHDTLKKEGACVPRGDASN